MYSRNTVLCFRHKNRNVSDPEKGLGNKKVALELAKPNEPVLIGSLLNIKDEST